MPDFNFGWTPMEKSRQSVFQSSFPQWISFLLVVTNQEATEEDEEERQEATVILADAKQIGVDAAQWWSG